MLGRVTDGPVIGLGVAASAGLASPPIDTTAPSGSSGMEFYRCLVALCLE